jgi:hypothetical protein
LKFVSLLVFSGDDAKSIFQEIKVDGFVKSQKEAFCVIPAKAGIQYIEYSYKTSGLRFSPE